MRLLAALLLSGCAHTTVFVDGRKVFATQADSENVTYRNGSTYFHADRLNHSTPTLAQGKAASDKITSTGAAIAASGLVTILK